MKKQLFSLLLVLLMTSAMSYRVSAQWSLTMHETMSQAMEFARQLKSVKHEDSLVLQRVAMSDVSYLHIYNIEGGGWVIASGDSRTRPILAYSDQGFIDPAQLPAAVRYWLELYEEEIERLGDVVPDELERRRKAAEVDRAQISTGAKDLDVPEFVDYMLPTIWGQTGYGYNSQTPYDNTMGGHVTVGCTAVAMGQLMRYYSYPWHGFGSHSYTYSQSLYPCWRYGTLSVNFAETMYNYYEMPSQLTDNSTDAQVEAVSTLLYHCGVACDMIYNSDCHGASGGGFEKLKEGAWRYFHFNPESRIVHRSNFARWQWIDTLKNEIGHGRPVMYAGGQASLGNKHAFVLDGYDQSNYFHINWGWNGSGNGYYSFDNPEGTAAYYFVGDQYCILDFEPLHDAIPVIVMDGDLVLDTSVISMNDTISGSYSFANIGDARGGLYVNVNVYDLHGDFLTCIDRYHLDLSSGTSHRRIFSAALNLEPATLYYLRLQVSRDSIAQPCSWQESYIDNEYAYSQQFSVVDTTAFCNLVLFAGFAEEASYTTFPNLIPIIERNFNYFFLPLFRPLFYRQLNTSFAFAMHNQRHGEICHFIDPRSRNYYLPYDPQVSPSGDPDPYPVCTPSQREMEFVSHVVRYIDSLHFVEPSARLDNDGDGAIDHLVIVMSKISADLRRGMMSDHTTRYPADAPPLTINGLRVDRYSLIGTSDTVASRRMATAIAHAMGMPETQHRVQFTDVLPDAAPSILSESWGAPSAIFKYRYLGLGDEPEEITSDGTYTINSSDLSSENNLYYIKSSLDSNQWFLIEYRYFGEDNVRNGLYFSRWMDTIAANPCFGGNAYADFYTTPNAYWTFRPNSDIDTVNGIPLLAHFSSASGRRFFSPVSNPHPFLADGTSELSFKVNNIVEAGDVCSFNVHFFTPDEDPYEREVGIERPSETPTQPSARKIYKDGQIFVERNGVVYDLLGRRVAVAK